MVFLGHLFNLAGGPAFSFANIMFQTVELKDATCSMLIFMSFTASKKTFTVVAFDGREAVRPNHLRRVSLLQAALLITAK